MGLESVSGERINLTEVFIYRTIIVDFVYGAAGDAVVSDAAFVVADAVLLMMCCCCCYCCCHRCCR